VTGTGALLRLALRLDRVRLAVWVIVLGLTPVATASNYQKLYPTQHDLDAVAGVLSNPSLEAIGGPLFSVTIGGLTAWKVGTFLFILTGIMSIFTVVRHSRTEEETGRAELLGATVVGRYAPVTAALLTAVIADVAAGALVALGMMGVGLPVAGSVAFGLAVTLAGLMFAAIAAFVEQFTGSARTANAISSAVLAAAYLLRAVGDTGVGAANWISPMGWLVHMRPFAGERWWVVALALGLVAVLLVGAYGLVERRDVGAGLLPDRPAPAQAAPSLRSPLALAWRLHRGLFVGWSIGMFVTGLVFGGVGKSITNGFTANSQLTDMLQKLGGTGVFTDAFFAACIGIVAIAVAAYTVQATLRMRAEESNGLLEPLLATGVGRLRWAASHLFFALVGTALILALAGVGTGLTYGASINDLGQVGRLLGAAAVQIPAAWVLAGFGTALFGLLPRLSSLAWAALVACVAVLEIGVLVGLPQWAIDISPFAHVSKLPGSTFSAVPEVWLVVVAAAFSAVGLAGFRRRDVG
jgi:ABC-2 type transport system permease protein